MSVKRYSVGKYIRLSQESTGYHRSGDDSASIENQDDMLTKFISMMPGWIETRTYVDDGASGAHFNRQGFKDMMEDVRTRVINLVIVKDLSRFGRNYLEAGRYLEEELPALGCRFIALTDGIDTETGDNDILPFLNAINDFYVRDASERIKSIVRAKAMDGHRIAGLAPYGYCRNPNERSRLIIDSYAAEVVRKAFALRVKGMSYAKVAGEMNKEGILPPRLYYFVRQSRETKSVTTKTWTIRTVKLMLNNETYIGNTISLKRGTRSYRDSREYKRDKSEWIRVENTHPAIIEAEIWDKVQQLNCAAKEKAAKYKESQQSLFSGLIICPDCNSKMGYFSRKKTKKDGRVVNFASYGCRTYTRSGQTVCSLHNISEKNLKVIALRHIREISANSTLDSWRIVESLKERLFTSHNTDKSTIAKEIRHLEQQLHMIDNRIEQLYEHKIGGIISNDEFTVDINAAEANRTTVDGRLKLLTIAAGEAQDKLNDINKCAALVKEKSTLEEVDREMLEAFIDKIEIGQHTVINGVATQDVRIFYKYVGLC